MAQQSVSKTLVIGWKIIGSLLVQSGMSEAQAKQLSPVWISIYNKDHDFSPEHIAKGIVAEMKGSLLSEDKFCQRLEKAKQSYYHLLFETSAKQTVVEPEVIVFNALLKNIILRLKEKANVIDLHNDLDSELGELHLSADAWIEVERWRSRLLKAMPEETSIVIELEDMKKFTHYIYTWTCEEIGPTPTDHIFTEALRVAEMLPESGKCHPKSFL